MLCRLQRISIKTICVCTVVSRKSSKNRLISTPLTGLLNLHSKGFCAIFYGLIRQKIRTRESMPGRQIEKENALLNTVMTPLNKCLKRTTTSVSFGHIKFSLMATTSTDGEDQQLSPLSQLSSRPPITAEPTKIRVRSL